jgi:hypothetical protein
VLVTNNLAVLENEAVKALTEVTDAFRRCACGPTTITIVSTASPTVAHTTYARPANSRVSVDFDPLALLDEERHPD